MSDTTKATKSQPKRASKADAASPPIDKSRYLSLRRPKGSATIDRVMCDLVAGGIVSNAATAMKFEEATSGTLSLTDMVEALNDEGAAINAGNLSATERMLNSQAVALNAIFGDLARRSALNMGEYLDAAERYMRLALKAQGQCRATLETLAAIKNPPIVYTRQMNVANGPQQVNNGGAASVADSGSRTLENQSEPNELLQDLTHGCAQMDTRATTATGRADQVMVPVEALDRAAH